jgi:hypothetical protein
MASAGPAPATDEIVLTLGDVLSRIPSHYLAAGAHDPKRELRFKINDLSSDIARGRAAVPLSRIAQLVPDIFVREVGRDEDMEVRLPLQKLVEQIGLLRSRPKPLPAVEKTTQPAAPADGTPRIVDVEARKEPTLAPAGMVEEIPEQLFRKVVPAPHVPPVVLGEQALGGQRSVELKPAAGAPPPVILGPPPPPVVVPKPVVEAKPVAPAPGMVEAAPASAPAAVNVTAISPTIPAADEAVAKPTAAPVPTAAPRTPVARPFAAPAGAFAFIPADAFAPPPPPMVDAPKPSPAPAPPAAVVPPSSDNLSRSPSKPQPVTPSRPGIVIDWGTDAPVAIPEIPAIPEVKAPETPVAEAKVSEAKAPEAMPPEAKVVEEKPPEVKVPEATMEPVRRGPAPPPAPRPIAPPSELSGDPGEEKIHLSLAAILRNCPPEIIVGQLPHVDDSVRITLPFAPIDRQLVKGQVEVSALRFVASLPEAFHKYFVAKVGVKVPIPLEEVFQNLPSPKHDLLIPVMAVPAPVVLAPAAAVAAPVPAAPVEVPPVLPVAPAPTPSAPEAAPAPAIGASVPPAATGAMGKPEDAAPAEEVDELGIPLALFKPGSVKSKPVAAAEPPASAPAPTTDEEGIPFAIFKPASVKPKPVAAAEPPPSVPAPAAISSGVDVSLPLESPAAAAENGAVPPPLPTATESPALAASVDAPTIAAVNFPAAEIPSGPKPEERDAVPAAAAESPAPQSTSAPAVGEPAPAAGEESPKLVLQRPVFRPFVVPPPPIFGFAGASAAPAEPLPQVEPPSIISGLREPVQTVPAAGGSVSPTTLSAAAPVAESPQAVAPASGAEVDAAPTAEMIASALEAGAPETMLPFSLQPAPFADLAETFAHETTYAPDLAEVVHVDVPVQETGEKPVAAEVEAKPAGESAGHNVAAAPPVESVVAGQTFAPLEPLVAWPPMAPAVPAPVEQTPVPAEPAVAGDLAASAEPVAPEHPAVSAGHGTFPVIETVGAAALGAVAAEVVFHKKREAEATAELTEPATESQEIVAGHEQAPAPAAESAAVQTEPLVMAPAGDVVTNESVHVDQPAAETVTVPPFDVSPPAATAEAAPIPETPVAPPSIPTVAPEPPAAAVRLPSPPIPLFPLPKLPVEPAAHLEVLPPPSLPLRRFDQDAVQALFMTEETLDLPKISRLAASLPGVYACVIATRDQACTGGTLPDGFDLAALLGLAPRVGEAAGRMPIGQLKHFTLYGDAYSVSFFERNGLSLCAVHRPRSFVPGVREKLVALADELSR